MIQRIQTIYLFVATVFSALGFFIPVFSITSGTPPVTNSYTLSDYSVLGIPVLIVSVLSVLMPLIIIFLYKKRTIQMRLGRAAMLVATMALALLVMRFGDSVTTTPPNVVSPLVGMFLHISSIILILLAIRAIKKDEALVRSADRIR